MNLEYALNALDDEVLEGNDRTVIEKQFRENGFYTSEYEEPQGGFGSYAFLKFIRAED